MFRLNWWRDIAVSSGAFKFGVGIFSLVWFLERDVILRCHVVHIDVGLVTFRFFVVRLI